MSNNPSQPTETEEVSPRYETDEHAEKRFHGWQLLALVLGTVALLAVAALIVDWVVIGPLRGRVY